MQPTVPKIDLMAGIECYCCTDFPGIGGSIKQDSTSFRVSELVDESSLGVSKEFGGAHRYPLYLLEKEGVDSNHALFEIEREHRVRLRVMGIKDAKAVTSQYAGTEGAWQGAPKELRTKHTRLTLQGFTKRPLGRKLLAGNEFSIIIQNPLRDNISGFERQVQKIANFYGLQRFGSERLVTHLVGRAIVKKDFAKAVELLLSYTTEYDTDSSREMRRRCLDPSGYRQALKEMPRGMDIERQLLSALVAGKEPIAALRAVPIQIRRLFVQAYQAYIFNRCVSRAIGQGEDIASPKQGDLCFEMEGPFTFGRIKKYDPSSSNVQSVPAVRMAGYTFQPGKGRFEEMTKELLAQEGVAAKDFYVKEMQELSQQGGFRQAPLWCRDFVWKKNPLTVSFKLPKGSYATTLLRELIKPENPVKAGF
ncbi:tRNA pseudouridine(13) synthase TruD [Nitrososphaera viennensis]|uniref:tRNA pseudouridine(13) synthase TruD n=2 Tax=Nitrososphaera viennensis TaxID=1034015 RepID=A0A977IDT7_9ARCH|nr:tRNA pseudouridine(13) synthase TruD [Nitrososphaera viennensis]AIC17057.1 putative tRNA pseudouridine synthase D [Nitrososphaera viennensis EN76]UVS68951.1 tRNA pseudouridine(13) synthase TruD [Nitrososphaera viennensis]